MESQTLGFQFYGRFYVAAADYAGVNIYSYLFTGGEIGDLPHNVFADGEGRGVEQGEIAWHICRVGDELEACPKSVGDGGGNGCCVADVGHVGAPAGGFLVDHIGVGGNKEYQIRQARGLSHAAAVAVSDPAAVIKCYRGTEGRAVAAALHSKGDGSRVFV